MTYAHALARAAENAGGVDALSAKLNVSKTMLRAWINGSYDVPVAVFLKAVDLLVEHDHVDTPPSDPKNSSTATR